MNKNTIIIIAALVIVAVAFVFLQDKMPGKTATAAGKYDDFAKCLTEKGATFYGSNWCGHCNNQKQMFGESLQYVNYIECAGEGGGQSGACEFAGITAYPTWDINGEKVQGAQTFETLSEKTGCALE